MIAYIPYRNYFNGNIIFIQTSNSSIRSIEIIHEERPMLYIILAALLLAAIVVVVILKKKKGSGGAIELPAFGKKKGNKKKSSRKDAEEEQEEISTPSFSRADTVRSSSLDEDTRREIEQLIRQKQYMAAEAQINQALHKNPTQQDLYLMLAEVHMHQDDEFALNQLIEHLRLSGLHSIVEMIDAKKEVIKAQVQRETEYAKVSALAGAGAATGATAADFDQFNTPSSSFEQLNQTHTTNNDFSQFDNLSQTNNFSAPPSTADSAMSFDDLNSSSMNTVPAETPAFNFAQNEPTTQNNSMDFSFSEPAPAVSEATASTDFNFAQAEIAPTASTSSMDFSFSEPTPVTSESPASSMDFSFSQPEPATPVAEPSMNFNFSEPTPAPAVSEPAQDLNFNFSEPTPTPAVSEPAQDFNFNFSEPTPAPTASEPTQDLNFNFSEPATTPVANEPAQDFNFNFSEPAATPATSEPAQDFNFNFSEPAPSTDSVSSSLDTSFAEIENSVTSSAPEAFDFGSFNLDSSVPQPSSNEPVVDVSEFLTPTDTSAANTGLDYSHLNLDNTSTSANVSSHTIENLDIMDPLLASTGTTAAAFAPTETTQDVAVSSDDPLLQAFPNLADYNTAEVHLKLAEQYIKLGAYDAAESLLQNRQEFNAQQNRDAEVLLQRLAS